MNHVIVSGLVRSHGDVGTALILVEDSEDFGVVQKMSVIVDVKRVNYMMINVDKVRISASVAIYRSCHYEWQLNCS